MGAGRHQTVKSCRLMRPGTAPRPVTRQSMWCAQCKGVLLLCIDAGYQMIVAQSSGSPGHVSFEPACDAGGEWPPSAAAVTSDAIPHSRARFHNGRTAGHVMGPLVTPPCRPSAPQATKVITVVQWWRRYHSPWPPLLKNRSVCCLSRPLWMKVSVVASLHLKIF